MRSRLVHAHLTAPVGLQEGYIPQAWSNASACNIAKPPTLPVNQNLGQAGAAPAIAQYAWPPRMSSVGRTTYSYAPTAPLITLPPPSATGIPGAAAPATTPGNGSVCTVLGRADDGSWFNAADTSLLYGPVAGTAYPDVR